MLYKISIIIFPFESFVEIIIDVPKLCLKVVENTYIKNWVIFLKKELC